MIHFYNSGIYCQIKIARLPGLPPDWTHKKAHLNHTFIHRTIEYRIHLHTLYTQQTGRKIQNKKHKSYSKQTNFNTQNKQNIIEHYVKSAN